MQVGFVVLVAKKCLLPPVAPLSNVMGHAGATMRAILTIT